MPERVCGFESHPPHSGCARQRSSRGPRARRHRSQQLRDFPQDRNPSHDHPGVAGRSHPGRCAGRVLRRILEGSSCARCGHPRHDFAQLDPDGYAAPAGDVSRDGQHHAPSPGVYRLDLPRCRVPASRRSALGQCCPSPQPAVGLEWCDRPSAVGSAALGRTGSRPCPFPSTAQGGSTHEPSSSRLGSEPCCRSARGAACGLIHSDGSRHINRVRHRDRTYEYTRYNFTSASDDIRRIFCAACDQLGVEWRVMNARNTPVARRASVARLDEFVGPKF